MKDKVCVITGATDGIGKETAYALALQGARLLIHGRDDTVVPFEQSEVMVDAMKKAGKPVEFVTLKHEDHWLSTGATRLQMLQATAAFLKTNNPAN